MILGPEFHRHVWQRFSWLNLSLLPILIGIGLLLSYMSFWVHDSVRAANFVHEGGLYAVYPHWSYRSLFLSVPLLFFALYFYGVTEASSAFTAELKNKTWDLPKMSAIRPAHLVLGKLFGTTSAAWYFGLGILACVLFAYANMFEDVTEAGNTYGPPHVQLVYPAVYDVFALGLVIILSAFVGHVVAVFGSLQNLARRRTETRTAMFVGLLVSYFLFNALIGIFEPKFLGELGENIFGFSAIWFGIALKPSEFFLYSLGFVLFWMVVGLHRMARCELGFQSYPFVWIAFLAALSVYFVGLFVRADLTGNAFALYCIPFIIFAYAAFSDASRRSSDIGGYLRFFAAWRRKDAKRMLETVPMWVPLFGITIIITAAWSVHEYSLPYFEDITFVAKLSLLVSLLLFAVRDCVMMHILLLGNRLRRGGLLSGLYFMFAYFIIPYFVFLLLSMFKLGAGSFLDRMIKHPDGYGYLLGAFYPSPQPIVSAAALLQVLLFAYVLWRVTHVYRQKAEPRVK